MNVNELFNLGNKFMGEGKGDMAMQMWKECAQHDPYFGPAYINMANTFKSTGSLPQARECYEKFLNCPLTGRTIDMLPKIKQELEELNKKA